MSSFGVITVKKHELLVPVGDMECLYQAVHNGADAVYLGGKSFGARKFAKNFTNEEIVSAIRYCHLYGVRIYVTMNTLVKNSEVDSFLEQARFLHQNGVDALIVQDFGMICLLREMFPNLEIHASTQTNSASSLVCELFHKIGVKRVVLPRELSLKEINSIDVDIEKEVFIHGALCISYSGECLMSSMLGGRSGNRGECAGVCRMPFSLIHEDKVVEKNKYLLSTKELNTSTRIKELLESDIDSFKIEGRMKSPFYVGFVTRFYRKLIDGEEFNLVEETNKLKTIFNREFTVGRIFNANDDDFMNTKSPNHIGLEIGKVIDVTKEKIKIQLSHPLHQGDAIRFSNSGEGFTVNYLYDEKMRLTSSSSSICYVDNTINLKINDVVLKTYDFLLAKEYENLHLKKIPISISVVAHLGEEFYVKISDGIHTCSRSGGTIQKAKNAPVSRESIEEHLNRLGNSPFCCDSVLIDMDEDIFIPIKVIHEIRRKLVLELIECRESDKVSFLEKEISFEKVLSELNTGEIHCSVMSQEQLDKCLELGVDRIYVPESLYLVNSQHSSVYLNVGRSLYEPKLKSKNLVSEFFESNNSHVGNYPLNVFNIYTAYYLSLYGFSEVCLSVELSYDEVSEFISLFTDKFGSFSFETFSYGRVENMIIKGNILSLIENDYTYYLEDSHKRIFPVYYDGRLTHILNYQCQDTNKFISNVRLDFYREDVSLIEKVVKKYQSLKRFC